MYKYWKKQEEIDILIYLFNEKGLTIEEICKEMKRSRATIQRKIGDLKLERKKEIAKKIKINSCSGKNNGMYGKKHKIETKQKMKKTRSDETKQKMKNNHSDTSGENNGMYGKKAWNNGLTKETNVILKNSGIKSSKTKKILWNTATPEIKQKRFNQLKEARKNARRNQTLPESIIEKWLIEKNIKYEKQKSFSYFLMDFYVNNKTVIECMGDYWHANPKFYDKELSDTQLKNKERDERKIKYLKTNNIDYILLWEYDIKNNFEEIKSKILSLL